MRYKVSNDEVAHLWVHQTQSHAEGSNFFFSGVSLYSYGHHFEVGRLVTGSRYRHAVILNSDSYSSSTNRHQSYARRAVSHKTTFYLPLNGLRNVTDSKQIVQFSFDYSKSEIRKSIDLASKARKYKEQHLKNAQHYANQFNALAEFFGSRKRITLPGDFDAMMEMAKRETDAINTKYAARQAQLRLEQIARHEIQMQELRAAIPQWERGEIRHLPHSHLQVSCLLRFIDDGKQIQTSMGAEFPTDHGKRAYRILKRLKDRGQSYLRNGHTLHCGHYAIDQMDQFSIRAGCHRLHWDVLEKFALGAGWNEGIEDENDIAENVIDGHSPENSRPDERPGDIRHEIGNRSSETGMVQ